MITEGQLLACLVLALLIIFLFYNKLIRNDPELVTPPPPTGVISATALTTPDSKPVADATANLVNPEDGSIADTQVTDANGAVTFKAVARGNYHIQIVGVKNPDGTWLQGDLDVTLSEAAQSVNVPMVCHFASKVRCCHFFPCGKPHGRAQP